MLRIKKFVFNSFQVNTFVVWDSVSLQAAIIDPGCFTDEEEERLSSVCAENSLNVKYLLNTHCHIDHVLGNNFVMKTFSPEHWAPEGDLPLLNNLSIQASMFGMSVEKPLSPQKYFSENTKLNLGEIEIDCIFTPGHSSGEYCFNFPAEKKCFTGDVLFKEGIGRTDLWGGSSDLLMSSIRGKLFALSDETEIFCGHGDESTIGHEKEHNPFL